MENNKRNREDRKWIQALLTWGDAAVREESKTQDIWEAFCSLWESMEAEVENGSFSPFLYIALSAELKREEAMFLAAVFYAELSAGSLTYSLWEKFWGKETGFPGEKLFYRTSQILFVYEEEPEQKEICVKIVPQIFLFLSRGILPERKIPGMNWYHRWGEPLPFLGKSARKYGQMERCRERIEGRKLFYLHGSSGSGRKQNYAWLAEETGKSLAVVPYASLQSRKHLREILVECILHHGMLAVELPEKEDQEVPAVLLEWMAEEENLFVLGEWEEFPVPVTERRQYLSFAIDARAVLRDREWFWMLTGTYAWEQETDRSDFLERYTFLPGKMRQVLELAKTYALSAGRDCISSQDIKRAVLQSKGHSLQKYAKKIQGIYTMEDLILPALQKEKLKHILHRVKNRKHIYEDWGFAEKSAYGNGMSMIFAGPPGTGKTMAAQAMAAELGMELYRVELPAVVDKYIGETEKKLNRIFEEAKKSMAILFFDEADVLFSKRTEMKESNDKYHNMEIAFLLQKMEEYDGVSILATNYLQNFDEAFRRRIHDIVDFPMPDEDSREKMWRTMIPDKMPVSPDLDVPFLARQFEITGSVIKNALIYGSFLAAESVEQILTMERILLGISHELEKSGKKLSREDYGEYHDL